MSTKEDEYDRVLRSLMDDRVLTTKSEEEEDMMNTQQRASEAAKQTAAYIEQVLHASSDFHGTEACIKSARDNADKNDRAVDSFDTNAANVLEKLVAASDELEQVVRTTSSVHHAMQEEHSSVQATNAPNDTFQESYLEEFTSAFGDELNNFRQEEHFSVDDVNRLLGCIRSSGDVFTPLQQRLFMSK